MKGSVSRLWGRVCAVTVVLLVVAAAILPVNALYLAPGYSDHRLSIVTKPGSSSKYLEYYKGGKEQKTSAMTWVEDEERGQVLELSGNNEYLQLISDPLPVIESTLAGWVNWQANGSEPVLFTLYSSITDDYLTLSLRHSDTTKRVDGIYLHLWRADGEMEMEWFNPVADNISYTIPENEWHHLAFTVDGQYFRLYIDGRLWFEQMVVLHLSEMRPTRLYIGTAADLGDGGTLKARLSDVCLYDQAMTAAQVGLLMQNGENPFDSDSASTTAATTLYYPTAPSTTTAPTTATTAASAGSSGPIVIGGFPLSTLLIMGGIVLAVILLSVILSIHKKGGGQK